MNRQRLSIQPWQQIGQFLCLFCICCFLILSCTQKPADRTPNAGNQRISIGTTLKIRTIDPADAYEQAASTWISNLGERLYTYKPGTTEIQPQLATALPKISKDGLTYRVPVRKGVVFHDGTPFDAKTMAFSLQRFMDNQGNPSALLADIVDSVRATGEYELTIQLKKPFAAFPSLLTFSGLCAVSPKTYEMGAGKFKPDTFAGTGPYKLVNYGTDSLKLDIFEQYWGEKPANQGVDVQFFTSPANLYSAFTTGAVDIAYQELDSEQIQSLEKQSPAQGWQTISAPGNYVSYWVLNTSKPPLNNPEIRQAITAIVDRQLLIDRVRYGQSEPLYSMIPTTFDVHKPAFKERYGDTDSAKAKQLLQKAGYTPEKPLKLEIWYPSQSNIRARVAGTLKAIAQQQLGGRLQLEINSVESATAFSNLEKGIYQTFLLDWFPDFFDADNYIQPFLSCSQGTPKAGCRLGSSQTLGSFYYSNRINQLIDQERKELNPPRRKAIFSQIQDIIAQDVPYIPLWQNKDYAFVQKGITGIHLDPTQQLPLWTIRKSSAN
ncbi:ABC transporter substrate-binding protein [Microcoleus sp. FACHB-672]|uniref:ABC transporter substrate-binding protein n=1 Tax=Microcoleus sp. FACHB-672 TaxID=2692825 RepID=UPI00168905AA|nr:ABC transporter substrate-binding protein [Microcoleus sp. FACHB-672]MBD2040031.1 peptide ABC transporter substrate-binding protein [Microcoleus sp. FACHB-672]